MTINRLSLSLLSLFVNGPGVAPTSDIDELPIPLGGRSVEQIRILMDVSF